MIWVIDQDTQNHDTLAELLDDFSASQLECGNLDTKVATTLSSAFGAYTEQSCFVTLTCIDGSDGEKQNEQVCLSETCLLQQHTLCAMLQAMVSTVFAQMAGISNMLSNQCYAQELGWVHGLPIGREGPGWVQVGSGLGQGWVQFLGVQVNPTLLYQLTEFFVSLSKQA